MILFKNIKWKSKVSEKNNLNYVFSENKIEKDFRQSFNNHIILDPLEIKFIKALKEKENPTGLNVSEMNDLMNLTKLSLENQRQRRYIFLKELNIKLFHVTGKRESIIRYSVNQDRREKYYDLDTNLKSLKVFKGLLN